MPDFTRYFKQVKVALDRSDSISRLKRERAAIIPWVNQPKGSAIAPRLKLSEEPLSNV